ncbi:A disintegrin and metalloproteinase with thrombospondin motifs 9 [Pseudolycoriella hygida]|uniref:A disintegrin and metalloproteinase with thrombospondin motifs 9 n=1 Tax=Pseudolycoriella hygida TaxID=35572 RepID=A0A9Q0RVE2_9DIPT|nr:A disintegrin and metalloproteinase with thrombospondin motifs 9 [Pseudolycoriella hygida]
MGRNETIHKTEENKDIERLQGCFYRGHVRGDDHSVVTVSLCEGMRGHIKTSTESFFIQPVEQYTVENPNILHKITRERKIGDHPLGDDLFQGSQCDTCKDKDCHHEDLVVPDEATESNNRRKRSIASSLATNSAYTMEVLVAVDKKMKEYHGDNLNAYVLTLMSIVSSIYADASIGNSINVAVSHIILFRDSLHDKSTNTGVPASEMLSSFCKSVQLDNLHYDTALLLTREQICRSANEQKCDTLGLAELNTMCKPASCAVVQDNGLSAAFTIAHELGHVLSMPHDDDTKCAEFRSPGKSQQNIMSRMLDHNTHPWSWSDCSRHYVTDFLENNYGFCMLDKPKKDMIEVASRRLAGEKFSADEQCKLVFGPESRVCSYMPTCARLWCGSDDDAEGCRTQHMPWADGTECGQDHWCQRGKCVHRNRHAIQKIDGGWGPFTPYDSCSRTCGGGVQSATRECNSPVPANGGKYCIGNRIKYKSCNTQECPSDAADFRGEQCANFNNKNYGITGIVENDTWIPKYGGDLFTEKLLTQESHDFNSVYFIAPVLAGDECKLYCRVEKTSNYFLLKDKVIDGTSCTHDSFNKCVNGVCRIAGCDNELSSNATLDKCGVCAGNNNTCIDIHGTFNSNQLKRGSRPYYYYVTTIPKGASNIEIIQPGYQDDLNYIALSDEKGNYTLNGNNVITQYPRVFAYGGVTFEYTGTNTTLERVNSSFARRIKFDLTVEIFSRKEHHFPDSNLILYSYTQSLNEPSSHFHPYYVWKMSEWSECDQICNGKRFRTAICIQSDNEKIIPPTNCLPSKKPKIEFEHCNSHCEIDWEATRSECSATCGAGERVLNHRCVKRRVENNQTVIIDDSYCQPTAKPVVYESCTGPCKNARWAYDEWGQCTLSCNGGIQRRNVYCLSDSNGVKISDNFCAHIVKEIVERTCNNEECPTWTYTADVPLPPAVVPVLNAGEILPTTLNNNVYDDVYPTSPVPYPIDRRIESRKIANHVPIQSTRIKWQTSRWGPCSVTCGVGQMMRNVKCWDSVTQLEIDDQYCTEDRPTNISVCKHPSCPEWNIGRWEDCKSDCTKSRQVTCQYHNGEVDERLCSAVAKPKTVGMCCRFKWRLKWSPCSTSCGTGIQKRNRFCVRTQLKSIKNRSPRRKGEIVDNVYCQNITVPHLSPQRKYCFRRNCNPPKWVAFPWSRCSVGCGQGYASREVKCMSGKEILVDQKCNKLVKPIKTKHCSGKTECKWKPDEWKSCTCAGYTKRRVLCYDTRLNKQSNSCADQEKPPTKKPCTPPPNCSCKGLHLRGIYSDGEYELIVRGRNVSIYCHKMNTSNPLEYISLNRDQNYASYYEYRSENSNMCLQTKQHDWPDDTIPSGTTYFSKVRLSLRTLQVIEDDLQFAATTGRRPQTYGSAGDCYSTVPCPQGRFSINFERTKFRIRPKTEWETRGQNATMMYHAKLEPPYQKIIARCGGYCGSCFPSKSTTIQLEII